MTFEVNGRLDGDEAFEAKVDEIVKRVGNMRPFWNDIGRWWTERQLGGLSGAFRLKPLASTTIEKRRRLGQGTTPLVATGDLRDATFRDSPIKATADEAIYGLRKGDPVRKVAIIQARGPRSAPNRRAVPSLTKSEREDLKTMLRKYVMKEVQ